MPRAKKPAATEDLPDGISLTPAGSYRVRWRDAGNQQQSRNFKRLVDAERHLRNVRTDVDRGTYVSPDRSRITVASFAHDEWLASARHLSPGGRDTYERDLDEYILPDLGGMALANLTAHRVDEYLNHLLEVGRAPSTVLRHYRTIHRMCHIAVQRGRLQTNPCVNVEAPRVPPTERHFLSVEQVLALADALADPPLDPLYSRRAAQAKQALAHRAFVLVAAFGGPRWSESMGLRRGRVEVGRIQIVEQMIVRDDGKWHREPPKSAAGRRTVSLPSTADRALQAHLRHVGEDPDALVYANGAGNPYNRSNFGSRAFKPALARAGLDPGVRVHDLRHTAAALAIRAGAHPKAIQVRLGHASIAITLDRYGHLFPEMDGEIAANLEGLVKAKPGRRVQPSKRRPRSRHTRGFRVP